MSKKEPIGYCVELLPSELYGLANLVEKYQVDSLDYTRQEYIGKKHLAEAFDESISGALDAWPGWISSPLFFVSAPPNQSFQDTSRRLQGQIAEQLRTVVSYECPQVLFGARLHEAKEAQKQVWRIKSTFSEVIQQICVAASEVFSRNGFEISNSPAADGRLHMTIRGRWPNDMKPLCQPRDQEEVRILFDKLAITPRNPPGSNLRRHACGSTLKLNFGVPHEFMDTLADTSIHVNVPVSGQLSKNQMKRARKKQQKQQGRSDAEQSGYSPQSANLPTLYEENSACVGELLVSTFSPGNRQASPETLWSPTHESEATLQGESMHAGSLSEFQEQRFEGGQLKGSQLLMEALNLELRCPWPKKQLKRASDCWGCELPCPENPETLIAYHCQGPRPHFEERQPVDKPDCQTLTLVKQYIIEKGHELNKDLYREILQGVPARARGGLAPPQTREPSPAEPSPICPWQQQELNGILPMFSAWLNANNLILTSVGADGNNCLINTVLQAAKGQYANSVFDDAEHFRMQIGVPENAMLTLDVHGERLLKAVNERYGTKFSALFEIMPCVEAGASQPIITSGVVDPSAFSSQAEMCIFVVQGGEHFQGITIANHAVVRPSNESGRDDSSEVVSNMNTLEGSHAESEIPSNPSSLSWSSPLSAPSNGNRKIFPETASLQNCGLLTMKNRMLPSFGTVDHNSVTKQCIACRQEIQGRCPKGRVCFKCHSASHTEADVARPGGHARQKRVKKELHRCRSPGLSD